MEFALILPVLVTLIFGMFSGGLVMMRKQSITDAAREGARYGATVPDDQCIPVSNCGGQNWAGLVQSLVVQRSGGDLTTAQTCVALVSGSGSSPVAIDSTHTTAGGTSPCYVDSSSDTGQRVQVSVSRPDSIDAVFFTFSVTLSGQATAKFES